MADEMEQIEARLAAYIDGALPPSQRAEIEEYLKANPTHAKLITELQSIKSAVSALPKDKAPAEVLDTLQSHLERHTLLEDVEESADTLRINRWPQLGAVAAVLLLAAGLGMLVYQVLPKHKGTAGDLALLTPSSQDDTSAGAGDVSLKDSDDGSRRHREDIFSKAAKLDDAAKDKRGPDASNVAANDGTAKEPFSNGINGGGAATAENQQQFGMAQNNDQQTAGQSLALAQNTPLAQTLPPVAAPVPETTAFRALAEKSSDGPAVELSDPVRVIIVRSDDPSLTQNLLVASLAQAGTSFELAPAAAATQPTTEPTRTVAAIAGKLLADNQLTLAESATPARPLVLHGLTADRAEAVLNNLNANRATTQAAHLAYDADGDAVGGSKAATQHSLAFDSLAARSQVTTTQADKERLVVGGLVSLDAKLSLNSPDSFSGRFSGAGGARAATTAPQQDETTDLVVFIVPTATAPVAAVSATQPATQPATTAPTTAPAPLEETP